MRVRGGDDYPVCFLDENGKNGRWYFIHETDGGICQIGYCGDCDGHKTKDGAYEHQLKFERDRYDAAARALVVLSEQRGE